MRQPPTSRTVMLAFRPRFGCAITAMISVVGHREVAVDAVDLLTLRDVTVPGLRRECDQIGGRCRRGHGNHDDEGNKPRMNGGAHGGSSLAPAGSSPATMTVGLGALPSALFRNGGGCTSWSGDVNRTRSDAGRIEPLTDRHAKPSQFADPDTPSIASAINAGRAHRPFAKVERDEMAEKKWLRQDEGKHLG